MVSRLTSLAQVIIWPMRISTSRAAPLSSSRCVRMVNGARSPAGPSIRVGPVQWAWITAFFESVEQRIGDEARHAEGVGEHQHGQRRVHVGLARADQPQVQQTRESQAGIAEDVDGDAAQAVDGDGLCPLG